MSRNFKQVGSVLLTFFLYWALLGWQIALVLIAGIVWHEMSHILAAKKMGLKTHGLVMIPFIGGVAFIGGPYKRYTQQAVVALAGPIGGGISAIMVYGIYLLTGVPFLMYASYILCLINLGNLVPLSLLDGGQVLSTITYSVNDNLGYRISIISTILAVIIIFCFNPFVALFVGALGGYSVYQEYRNRKFAAQGKSWLVSDNFLNKPKKMTTKQICLTVGVWVLTVVILIGLYLLTR